MGQAKESAGLIKLKVNDAILDLDRVGGDTSLIRRHGLAVGQADAHPVQWAGNFIAGYHALRQRPALMRAGVPDGVHPVPGGAKDGDIYVCAPDHARPQRRNFIQHSQLYPVAHDGTSSSISSTLNSFCALLPNSCQGSWRASSALSSCWCSALRLFASSTTIFFA